MRKEARQFLKRLGNPYASVQLEGLEDEVAIAPTNPARVARIAAPEQRDFFAHHSPQSSPAEAPSGNPYAVLAQLEDPETPSHLAEDSLNRDSETASQAEFERSSRRIFAQYIPALERGKLRPEHREFIARNKGRSGRIRYRLIKALQRYDLSNIVGLQPQFNREREELTAKKLAEVERSVDAGE